LLVVDWQLQSQVTRNLIYDFVIFCVFVLNVLRRVGYVRCVFYWLIR